MSPWETIGWEMRGAVAWVTLDRPRMLNAYNIQMRDELFEALGLIADDPAVRVAVLQGAGDRAFCAGADLTEFGTAPSQAIARRVRFERDVWGRFLSLRKPLVAAIQGYCLGSGLEIALCCDIRLASEEAQFGLPETALGMVPAAAGSQTLPRAIGTSRALQMLLTGERVDAAKAHRLGLINRVVPKAELHEQASALAEELAALPRAAQEAIKVVVRRGMDTSLAGGCALELRTAFLLSQSARQG